MLRGTLCESNRDSCTLRLRPIGFSPIDSLAGFAMGELGQEASMRFTLAQRANTALRALSLRSCGVMLAALANPPFFPPRLPSKTA